MLAHEDLELEDDERLLDGEEEVKEPKLGGPQEELLESESVPSLSEASSDSDSVAMVIVGTLHIVLHLMVFPFFLRKP